MQLYHSETGTGEPVILLHGLFGMGDNLSAVAKVLAAQYRVMNLDLPNHGRSDFIDTMGFQRMAEAVISFMDANNIAKARFLGHSLGGKVLMQLALSYPERVEQLIVADIAPVTYPSHHDAVLTGLAAVNLSAIQSRRDADSILSTHIEESPVRQFLLKSLYRNEQGDFQWRFNLSIIEREYDAIRQGLEGKAFMGGVLFIKGGNSPYIRADNQPAMEGLFPNFTFKIIQNAGHWLHAEKPAAFNNLVLNFFNS